MEPEKNKKKSINRVEMIAEDRTRYFGENISAAKQNRIEPEKSKTDPDMNVPKNINTPLTMDKKNIEDYQRKDHQEYKGDKGKTLFILMFLVLAGGAGYGIYHFRDKISVKIPKFSASKTKETKGIVNGEEKTVISQINGKVTEMNLAKGTPVKQGELLIIVENPLYKTELDRAERELREALARNAYTQVVTEETKVVPVTTKKTVATTGKKTYSNEILIAEEKFRNDREAYNAGLISRVEYEQSLSEINRAREREKKGQPVVVTETKAVNTKVESKKMIPVERKKVLASPEITAAIEKYKSAFVNYESTKIFSDTSGVITELYTSQGQDVAQGQKLFKIVNSGYLYTEVNISDKELNKAGIGNIVKLVSNIDSKEYEGIIVNIKKMPETQMNLVKIAVNNKNKGTLISIGSYVNITITKKTASKDLTALLDKQKNDLKEDNTSKTAENADEKVKSIIDEVLK